MLSRPHRQDGVVRWCIPPRENHHHKGGVATSIMVGCDPNDYYGSRRPATGEYLVKGADGPFQRGLNSDALSRV